MEKKYKRITPTIIDKINLQSKIEEINYFIDTLGEIEIKLEEKYPSIYKKVRDKQYFRKLNDLLLDWRTEQVNKTYYKEINK